MSGLVISYSGVRGVVGRDLDTSVARRFGAAFRRMVAELHPAGTITLVVGRDTRASGPELQSALMQGLSDERVRIIDLDVAPTPTIQFALGALKAHGAVAVTASHNPAQWNGFKFLLAPDNTVLDGAQTERLIRELAQSSDLASAVTRDNQQDRAVALHVARVLEQVDGESIRRRRFRVALDAARGAGERPALRLLDALGCTVHARRRRARIRAGFREPRSARCRRGPGRLRGGVRARPRWRTAWRSWPRRGRRQARSTRSCWWWIICCAALTPRSRWWSRTCRPRARWMTW